MIEPAGGQASAGTDPRSWRPCAARRNHAAGRAGPSALRLAASKSPPVQKVGGRGRAGGWRNGHAGRSNSQGPPGMLMQLGCSVAAARRRLCSSSFRLPKALSIRSTTASSASSEEAPAYVRFGRRGADVHDNSKTSAWSSTARHCRGGRTGARPEHRAGFSVEGVFVDQGGFAGWIREVRVHAADKYCIAGH